jgi:hypothetical protein
VSVGVLGAKTIQKGRLGKESHQAVGFGIRRGDVLKGPVTNRGVIEVPYYDGADALSPRGVEF